ncbi:MAG: hypothetical protein HQK96_03815 [Nitrospirae bacterium]|nr:hypothetical protein [Nitrospirota bacterium]
MIEEFNIKDDNAFRKSFVKIEFYPDDQNDIDDEMKYNLHIDEESTPDWFMVIQERITEDLRDIIRRMIIKNQSLKIITGKCIILSNSQIEKLQNVNCFIMKSSNVGVMKGSSNVGIMWGSSKVGIMWGNSNVGEMWGSSKVGVMWENSNVGVMKGSSKVGIMWGSSKVGEMWENSNVGVMKGSSKVGVMWGSSKVGVMWGSSKVGVMWGSSKVGVIVTVVIKSIRQWLNR